MFAIKKVYLVYWHVISHLEQRIYVVVSLLERGKVTLYGVIYNLIWREIQCSVAPVEAIYITLCRQKQLENQYIAYLAIHRSFLLFLEIMSPDYKIVFLRYTRRFQRFYKSFIYITFLHTYILHQTMKFTNNSESYFRQSVYFAVYIWFDLIHYLSFPYLNVHKTGTRRSNNQTIFRLYFKNCQ